MKSPQSLFAAVVLSVAAALAWTAHAQPTPKPKTKTPPTKPAVPKPPVKPEKPAVPKPPEPKPEPKPESHPEPAAETADLQATLTESLDKFIAAFEERDAKKIAALFTPEAEYIDGEGTIFHGREAIEAEYAASFEADPKGTLDIELTALRPIAKGVVVEEGLATFIPEEDGPSPRSRYTALHVQQPDGTWLMASVRQLGAAEMSSHDYLRELTWLVGKWREEVDGTVTTSEWNWSENEQYLVSEFSVQAGDVEVWSGTHRVGWDAERKQFRSWIFDSNGIAVDGWWREDEGTWSVALSGSDAEGARLTLTLSYATDGPDAIVVSQTQRVRGGASLPDLAHRIVRQPPAPGEGAEPDADTDAETETKSE